MVTPNRVQRETHEQERRLKEERRIEEREFHLLKKHDLLTQTRLRVMDARKKCRLDHPDMTQDSINELFPLPKTMNYYQ